MRYFKKGVTVEDLKAKIEKAKNNFDDDGYGFDRYNWRTLTPQVEKDLCKIEFDCENVTEPEEGYTFGPAENLCGYHTLPNGLTFYGLCAGGDWEAGGAFFILYLDHNNKLRGYVPEDGNSINLITKQAYGNDEEKDVLDIKKRYGMDLKPEDVGDFEIPDSENRIVKDIQSRIVTKTQ